VQIIIRRLEFYKHFSVFRKVLQSIIIILYQYTLPNTSLLHTNNKAARLVAKTQVIVVSVANLNNFFELVRE
jgi:hypothetical protein